MSSSYPSSMVGIQGQSLEVTVVGCSKLKDTEWISRQDPYVCLEYASTKFRTRTCTDGGKNPVFQEKFVFPLIEGLRELIVLVWNSNTLSFDDFIGTGKIQLHKVLSHGFDDSAWPLQTKTGRYAGEVKLILHYANHRKSESIHAPPYVPPPATPLYSMPPHATSYPSAAAPFPPLPSPYPTSHASSPYPSSSYPHASSPYPTSHASSPYPSSSYPHASSPYPTSHASSPYPTSHASSPYPTSHASSPYPSSYPHASSPYPTSHSHSSPYPPPSYPAASSPYPPSPYPPTSAYPPPPSAYPPGMYPPPPY